MAKVWRRNIAENFNRLSKAHECYRQTTDGRTTTYSKREREFTFAKNWQFRPQIMMLRTDASMSSSLVGSIYGRSIIDVRLVFMSCRPNWPVIHSVMRFTQSINQSVPVRVCAEAAGQGHLNVIRFLLSNGADTSLVDSANETARDVAIRFRQLAAVKLLSPNIGQNPVFFPHYRRRRYQYQGVGTNYKSQGHRRI